MRIQRRRPAAGRTPRLTSRAVGVRSARPGRVVRSAQVAEGDSGERGEVTVEFEQRADSLVIEIRREGSPAASSAPPLADGTTQRAASRAAAPTSTVTAASVVDALRPSTVPEWRTAQADLLRDRLAAVSEEFGMLRSSDVSALSSPASGNASANPTRWARKGRVVAIRTNAGNLYPGFQFDLATGTPLPVMADLVATWGSDDPVGLVLWCVAPNEWLDDERPVDHLTHRPDQVRRAIRHAVEP